MVTITGADTYFTNVDDTITQTQWESFITQAIDKINGYGADIAPMSGSAGSQTWSGESKEAGFIRSLAVALYNKDYGNSGAQSSSYGLGSLSESQSLGSGQSSEVEILAINAAKQLKELDISIG